MSRILLLPVWQEFMDDDKEKVVEVLEKTTK